MTCVCCRCHSHEACAATLCDLLPCRRNTIVIDSAADSPRISHARLLRHYVTGAHGQATTMRVFAEWADSFPDSPHVCFLLDLLQLLLLPLLLSRSAHGHGVRLKSPFRYARRRFPRTYSHCEALAASVSHLPQVPPSLRAAKPSPSDSSDDGGTVALPAAPTVGGD